MTSAKNDLPEIRKTVVLRAPLEKVWKAVASSEGIAAWFMENTFEPVLGHEFVLRSGQFGDSSCRVTEWNPPYALAFDWGKDWHVQFELKLMDEQTTQFTLIHSGWDAAKITEFGQPHTVVRNIMNGGWESIVHQKLVQYVDGAQ